MTLPHGWTQAHELVAEAVPGNGLRAVCTCGEYRGPERRGHRKRDRVRSDHFRHLTDVSIAMRAARGRPA